MGAAHLCFSRLTLREGENDKNWRGHKVTRVCAGQGSASSTQQGAGRMQLRGKAPSWAPDGS